MFSGFDQKVLVHLHWLHPVFSFKIIREVKCVLKCHIPGLDNWGLGSTFDVYGVKMHRNLKQVDLSFQVNFLAMCNLFKNLLLMPTFLELCISFFISETGSL